MSYFEFPHTRNYEGDLGEIIKQLMELTDKYNKFFDYNSIKFADPIEWDITSQYPAFMIVFDSVNESSYISKQPVPAGIELSNSDYWSFVGPLIVDGYARTRIETILHFVANAYETGTTATAVRNIGDYVMVGGNLYVVTSSINVGDTYTSGYNITATTIEEMCKNITLKNMPVVTPEMFGALGNGLHDDTEAINNALSSGYMVLFNSDTYLVSDNLVLHSNMVLESSRKSIIKMKSYTNKGFINANELSDIIIKNIEFDIDAGNQSSKQVAIMFTDSNNITFENVIVDDQYSVAPYDNYGNVHFEDCTNIILNDCTVHDSSAENLVFIGCADIWVNGGNYYNALNGSAIAITGGTRSHITNANIANTKGSGISLNSDYSEVKGCTIKNVDTTISASNGITCGHSRDYNADNSIISNNIIDTAPNGIGSGASYNIIIANNTITNINGYGIRTVNNSANCSVENNNVSNAVSGILVNSNQSYIGNTVTKCTNGFVMSIATGASLIGNKIFDNSSNGIYDTGTSSNNSYINNECSSTTTPSSQPYGMVLRNTGNVVIGNICKNNGTMNISVPAGNYAFMNVTSDTVPVVNDQYDGFECSIITSGSLKTKIKDLLEVRQNNSNAFVMLAFGSGVTDNPFTTVTSGFLLAVRNNSYSSSIYCIAFNGTATETATISWS